MVNIYRERVTLDGGTPQRASVFFVSQYAQTMGGGSAQEQTISATFPPRAGVALAAAGAVGWDGKSYLIQGVPEGVRALGRIDHWKITAIRNTG